MIHSSGKIKVQTLSWDRDNLKVREIYDRIGLGGRNTMVFLCGTNRKDLVPFDLAQIDRGGLDPMTNVIQPAEVRNYNVESAVTTALLSVMEEDRSKVYVTTGRREASMQDMAGGGLARAVAGLRMRLNFEVEELKLYQDKIVPPDCDVLIIPGPLDDFSTEEVAAVKSFLYGGGRLFLADGEVGARVFIDRRTWNAAASVTGSWRVNDRTTVSLEAGAFVGDSSLEPPIGRRQHTRLSVRLSRYF